MASWTGAALTRLQSRQPISIRWAVVSLPKTFAGVVSPVALWTGVVDLTSSMDGTSRTYKPIGNALEIGPINYSVGTEIGYLDLSIPLTSDGEAFVRGLDTREAPTQLHCLLFDPDTGALLGTRRYWKGTIENVGIPTPTPGGQTKADIRLASSARRGTLSSAGKKSDESQRQRDQADRMRQYGDLGTKANDPWGTENDD